MIIKNINPIKLLNEFSDRGVTWVNSSNNLKYSDNGTPLSNVADMTITFTHGTNMDLVQSVIDAHDPTPVPRAPTKEEILEQELARTNEMILELTELILGGM